MRYSSNVTVSINGTPVQVLCAGGWSYPGEDQINILLPRSLAGAGNVALQLIAAGLPGNPVQLTI
jgi:uncharacterized protein (TIGR03437 family)